MIAASAADTAANKLALINGIVEEATYQISSKAEQESLAAGLPGPLAEAVRKSCRIMAEDNADGDGGISKRLRGFPVLAGCKAAPLPSDLPVQDRGALRPERS